MYIPSEVKIGPHKVSVLVTDCGDDCGTADPFTNTIRINQTLPESQQGTTFFHETMHFMNSELDHALLDALSQQMYTFLTENNLLK